MSPQDDNAVSLQFCNMQRSTVFLNAGRCRSLPPCSSREAGMYSESGRTAIPTEKGGESVSVLKDSSNEERFPESQICLEDKFKPPLCWPGFFKPGC